MKLLKRASRLLEANVHHVLDAAEDPEVMVKQLLRDMEEAVVDLRRETVHAVAREKHLERKISEANAAAAELESQAVLAVENNDRDLARRILNRRFETLKSAEAIATEQKAAGELARRLKSDLARMEEQAAIARRRKDDLVRRKRAAESRLRSANAARRSIDSTTRQFTETVTGPLALDGYADSISEMEARADAAREVSPVPDDSEREIRDLVAAKQVDEELERLIRERNQS